MSRKNHVSFLALAACAALGAASSGCYVITAPAGGGPPEQASIDTDATLTETPGVGAGAFVEYASNGHWTVFTTCDYKTSGVPCLFDIVVTPAEGATLSNPMGQSLGTGEAATLNDDGTVSLSTETSTGLNGMTFDADAGATVEVDMTLDGSDHPELLFWVSNGHAQHASTNPVDFVPTAP
jgi:hypothetical protein